MKILVPVDFGKSSLNVCSYAIQLAQTLHGKITLINVFENPVILGNAYREALRFDVHAKMVKMIATLRKVYPDFKPETVLMQGDIDEVVIKYAKENKTDIILTGTSGYGPVARRLLGNPSLNVMRNAPCMVLSIPRQAHFKGMRKIVYATDLSEASLKSASSLITLAEAFNSEIMFLYVSLLMGKETNVEMKEVTKKIKAAFRYSKVSGYVCDDLAADDGIRFFLQKVKSDCLVLYASHQPLLKRLFHKSVIKAMALHTTVPLLVIHGNDRPLKKPAVKRKTTAA